MSMIRSCLPWLMSLLVLPLAGCPTPSTPPSTPINYERIVIETYDPTGLGAVFTSPFISLFGPNGDTTADTSPNEWNNDIAPYTVDGSVALAESGTAGTWVTIDYTGGLTSGVYYVRVRGAQTYQTGAYAIRFLSLKTGDPLPAYSYYLSTSDDSAYEPDDTVVSGVPTNPVAAAPGDRFNRNLQAASDMDWFKLTLP